MKKTRMIWYDIVIKPIALLFTNFLVTFHKARRYLGVDNFA